MRVCPQCGGHGSCSPDKLLECPWCLDGILMILINPNCEECKGTGNVTKQLHQIELLVVVQFAYQKVITINAYSKKKECSIGSMVRIRK